MAKCLGCGREVDEHDLRPMAGLPYHTACAEQEMDFMDRADAHFRAQEHILAKDVTAT